MCISRNARTSTSDSSTRCAASASNPSRSASMRRIIRRREILVDQLRYAGEAQEPGTVAIQKAAEWIARSGAATDQAAILLTATDKVEELAPHLPGIRWIVIEFAKIGEGRGYSQARLLRQR